MSLTIHWTKHAIARAGERFGFDQRIKIPNRVIQKAAADVEPGDQYRIRRGQVTYVCKRLDDGILIVTVIKV